MPFRPDGTFQRNMNWQNDAAADIDILADRHDNEDDNFAAGLSETITKSGKSQPTADIPMNGKRLINLGAPVNNTDAATKAYADAVRAFTTSLTLSGNAVDGRINFTGTGTVGLGFTVADLGFGVKPGDEVAAHNRFVWNGKPDFSGVDGMVLTDEAQLGIGQVPPFNAGAGVYSGLVASDSSHSFNAYWSNVDSKWHFWSAGWAMLISLDKATGFPTIYRSSATGAADAVITWESIEGWNAAKQVAFPATVFAGSAYLHTDGNVAGPNPGSIWLNYGTGHTDAYTAILNRIEARAYAAVVVFAVTDSRMAGAVDVNISGVTGFTEFPAYVMTGVQGTSAGGDKLFRWRQPQLLRGGIWYPAFAY